MSPQRQRKVKRGSAATAPRVSQRVEQAAEIIVSRSRLRTSSFVDFIRERGVVGLAVGIILGSSVTAAANSFVENIIDPLLALMIGSKNRLDEVTFHISKAEIRIGQFVTALIDVLVIILLLFVVFKLLKLEKLDKKKS